MPRNRGRRVRVAPAIYRDAKGYAAQVQVGSGARARRKEKRFARGTELADMRAWQAKTRTTLTKQVPVRAAAAGTLAGDIEAHLPTIRALPSWVSRRSDLRAWLPRFGDRRRRDLTASALNEQIHDGRTADVAASTCNHRRGALIALWEALDGPDPADSPNPARQTDHMEPPPLQARDIAPEVRAQLLRAMYPGVARAMWWVMSATGLPPARMAAQGT